MSTATSFYQTGGTLAADAPSYVERRADHDLYHGLSGGEFCYVLTARQMGKSSLMARTAQRLRREGVAVVTLDLTAIGQNLSPEQWYDGLLSHLGQELHLEDALDDFWLDHGRLGPLQRWLAALRQVILPRLADQRPTTNDQRPTRGGANIGRSSLVIFLDEIDAVRSLPFSTDEFFAAVRECYNRRTQDPEFRRLTFCLLGVASPSDLIRDTRTTPFNIGRRVELTDFTEAEAAPLAVGLLTSPPSPLPETGRGSQNHQAPPPRFGEGAGGRGQSNHLLPRILYWTGGHPYLTQRLCRALVEDPAVTDTAAVDRLCEALFLSPRARERDDNLLFVREQLLRGEADAASLLDLYGQIRRGRRVEDDEADPLVTRLRLSGITRGVEGHLTVRNRIYAHVFDPSWVQASMPDAEVRRQRAAFRRGVLRAAAIAGAVILVVTGLAVTALRQARRANRVAHEEARQRRLAQEGQKQLRWRLYAARMSVAYQAEQAGNTARARQLLEALRPDAGQEDLRGFEWRYLWQRCQDTSRATLRGHVGGVYGVAVSPDGRTVASAGEWDVRLWDVRSRRQVARFDDQPGHLYWNVAFSPNGKLLAASNEDGTVKLWDVASRHLLATLKGHQREVRALAFSPDSRLLASGCRDERKVKLWDVASRREIAVLPEYTGNFHGLAISPDGRSLAMGQGDGRVILWDLVSRRAVTRAEGHTGSVSTLAFSSDGRFLASGSVDNSVRLWARGPDRGHPGMTLQTVAVMPGHGGSVNSVVFSPDGRLLASGGDDHTIQLWSVLSPEMRVLRGHAHAISSVAFTPDGRSLIAGSYDGTIKLWDVADRRPDPLVIRPGVVISALGFSPTGRLLAIAGENGTIRLCDVASGRVFASLVGHQDAVLSLSFSPDGRRIASGSEDRTVKLWDVASRRMLASLPGFTGGAGSVRFSPDGRTLAMWGQRVIPPGERPTSAAPPKLAARVLDDVLRAAIPESVRLIDLATKRTVASVPAAPESYGIAFSPDGKLLAALSRFGTVTLWNTASGRAAATLPGHDVLGFSPDGRTLAVRDYAGSPKLWDLISKKTIASLGRHATPGEVAFAPDLRTLATTAAHPNEVLLWSLTTQDEAATLKGHTGGVVEVAFSPNGNTLASGSTDGTVRLWRAPSLLETEQLAVVAAGGDRQVLLTWRPVPSAVGYTVYRAASSLSNAPWVTLTPRAIRATAFLDQSSDLVNGRPQTYAVAPVFAGGKGKTVEGTRVRGRATPIAPPPGFAGYSMDEEVQSGSATYDAPSGLFRIRSSGSDIYYTTDHGYFLSRPLAGDFEVTVTAVTRPIATNQWAKAGLMVRETPAPGARNAFLAVTPGTMPGKGLSLQWRPVTNDASDYQQVLSQRELKTPLTLRLTRRGDTITAAYSWDGVRFQPAGEPWTFSPALAETLQVGLAISSHDIQKTTEATFRDLQIRRR